MSETLNYYQDNSQAFFDSTVNADVMPLYEHFVKYVPVGGKVLDFGCGSGRDTKYFLESGFSVDAIDGSEKLCQMASEYTGVDVKCMDFMSLDSFEEYDAVWACASILHVGLESLPIVLEKMKRALKPSGVMYISFKYGDFEGVRDERFFTDMTSERFSKLVSDIGGLITIEEWFSEDVRPDKNVRWYNTILRKE